MELEIAGWDTVNSANFASLPSACSISRQIRPPLVTTAAPAGAGAREGSLQSKVERVCGPGAAWASIAARQVLMSAIFFIGFLLFFICGQNASERVRFYFPFGEAPPQQPLEIILDIPVIQDFDFLDQAV